MMRRMIVAVGLATLCAISCGDLAIGTPLMENKGARIIDHADANVDGITAWRIVDAKEKLVVAYWHTSHGSQLISGIDGMDAFFGDRGWFILNGEGGLSMSEQSPDIGQFASDLDDSIAAFQQAVKNYLGANPTTNVIMASWCGQVSSASESKIKNYLTRMSQLEADYPNVTFVYMTGHSDSSGDGSDGKLAGNLHLRNRQIREYCENHGKWLYDFYDIECYDPDGRYYGDKHVTDSCDFDGGNWATEWQNSHVEGPGGDWWNCSAAHSQPLNGNQKAKAAWQLWCAIADSV
jgi:hypothetical protein